MSDRVGPLTFGDEGEPFLGRDIVSLGTKRYSEETVRIIDEEVKALVDDNHRRAATLLEANQEVLGILARKLKEEETIEGSELRKKLQELGVNTARSELVEQPSSRYA